MEALRSSRLRRLAAVGVALVALAPPLLAQGGTATGVVTDSGSGKPVVQARVLVIGTTIGTMTGDNGRYTLRGIPTGPRAI